MLEKERFNMSWIWLDIVRWHEIANLVGPYWDPSPGFEILWECLGWLSLSVVEVQQFRKNKTRERERERTFSNTFHFGRFWAFPKILGALPKLWKKPWKTRIANDIQWQSPVTNHPVMGWFVQAMSFIPPWRKPIRSARCMAWPNGKSQKIQNRPYGFVWK